MSEPPVICGIDEAGRGPLAGPVVAASVIIPEAVRNLPFWQEVTDSKKLTPKKRESLSALIQQHAIHHISISDIGLIDRINILQANLEMMRQSFLSIYNNVQDANINILIDGNIIPKKLPCPAEAIVKGDTKILEIGAASILAKVARDRIMLDLHKEFPHYGWDTNKGYGSKKHLLALREFGPTPHHRKSFAPVREALENQHRAPSRN